ncbi:MAG: pro-sigmaK processing inhibitor BofA family protein [Bacillota bacterium]|jgi:inhibitor of the pro-sigma K processing machinery
MLSFDNDLWRTALIFIGGIGFLFALSFLPQGFWRFVGKLVLNCVLGLLVIFVINFFGAPSGFGLPFNWLTLAISGILGIPGVVALTAVAFLV